VAYNVRVVFADGPYVAPTSLDLTTGQTGTFTVSLGQSGNAAASATVTSGNTAVATVNTSSVDTSPVDITVTGISAGSTVITIGFSGTGGNKTVSVTVQDAPAAPDIATTTLPDGQVSSPYSQTLNATGDTPITWTLDSGSLPDGLSLNGNTGEISGTPTAAGTFDFTVKAENGAGNDTQALSVVIQAEPVTPEPEPPSPPSRPSSSGGSSSGSDRFGTDYTTQQGIYWIELNEARTLAGTAREKGDSYVRTRRAASAGIRRSALAELSGLRYEHDTIAGGAVQVRITIPDPAKATKDVLLSGYVKGADVDRTRSHFEKWFTNKLRVIHLEQQGDFGMAVQIAALVDLTGMDTTNLHFYSYDKAANTYRRIENPAYWIDANGYLHFTTQYGGDIVISDGTLEMK